MESDENAGEEQVEEKSDREEGGPTADESAEDEATGAGKGTRDTELEPHE